MDQVDEDFFQRAFPRAQIAELNAQLAQAAQQAGDVAVLVAGVEAVHQLVAVGGQRQGHRRQAFRHRRQRLGKLQAQFLAAQLLHQGVLVFHQHNLTPVDHADPVGHLLRFLDVVGGENNGDTVFAQAAHHFPHIPAQLHVDTGGGLVEKQNARFMGQGLGDHHAPFHAAGQGDDLFLALVPQGQVTQHFLHIGRVLGLAEQPAAERDRGPDRLEGVGGQLLGHQADGGPGGAEIPHDVMTVGQHGAGGGIDDAADDADQGRLAGAVGAQQGKNLAPAYFQIHVLESLEAGVIGLVELLHGNDRTHDHSLNVFVALPVCRSGAAKNDTVVCLRRQAPVVHGFMTPSGSRRPPGRRAARTPTSAIASAIRSGCGPPVPYPASGAAGRSAPTRWGS